MQQLVTRTRKSACPHDCPSGCSLEVAVEGEARIGRVTGDKSQTYTAGVVCAKVARYAERVHHRDRLLHPMRRIGLKGEGRFERVSWDAALELIAEAFERAAAKHGRQAVWPYHSGGTMGQVQRYGMELFRNALGYSRQHSTICSAPADSDAAGKVTDRLAAVVSTTYSTDPSEKRVVATPVPIEPNSTPRLTF